MPSPVEVEPPWVGVDLHRDAVLSASFQNPFNVDFISRAALQLTTGHVADNCRVGISDRLQYSLRLFLPRHFETAVNARDNEVEFAEHAVGIIERTVSQNIRLDSFQDTKGLAVTLVKLFGLAVLFRDLIQRQAARIMRGYGMIRDAEIFETTLARCFCHRLQCLGAVRRGGMAVKYAVKIFVADKLRQAALCSPLQFVTSFPKFRLYKLKTQGVVDVVLRCCGDELLAPVETIGFQSKALAGSKPHKLLKVHCRTGRVQQACAEMLFVGYDQSKPAREVSGF